MAEQEPLDVVGTGGMTRLTPVTVSSRALFWRSLVVSGLPFGTVMGWLPGGGWIEGLVSGVIFGLFMAWGVLGWQPRHRGRPLAVRQDATLVVAAGSDEARGRCRSALCLLCGHVRDEAGPQAPLVGRRPAGWKSWGEIVRVELAEAGGGMTRVNVSSRPRNPLVQADYGRNWENVRVVFGVLEQGVRGS